MTFINHHSLSVVFLVFPLGDYSLFILTAYNSTTVSPKLRLL